MSEDLLRDKLEQAEAAAKVQNSQETGGRDEAAADGQAEEHGTGEPVAEKTAEAQPETVQAEDKAEETETPQAEAVRDPKDEKIEELQNRILRLQADFDNFRRRNNAEREQLATFVTADVVGKFLSVLDNLERAEAAASKATEMDSLLQGMQNIQRQFTKTLTELGVKEIPAQDQKFDPKVHEAVMRGQNPDLEDDTIDAVFEKGYELNQKVIRHSKVRVINNG